MKISYTKIKTYLECSYKYKLRYIERIPQRPKSYFKFSSLIHKALHEYHFYHKKGNLNDLLLCYERVWRGKRSASYEEGRKILTDYYYKMRNRIPYSLEERFTVREGENTLVGKIDRIDKVGNRFQIIDYKLNKTIPTAKEVKDSLQLNFYTLIFFYLTGIIPSKVGFYLLRYGKLLFTKRNKKDIEKTKDLTDYITGKIIREEFQPKESRACRWCNYKEYCLSEKGKPIQKLERKRLTQLVFPL
ncbi:MAG: PD-(D/E)XK nuclease family protein [Candidatus Aerophobetes bacterium]|nr:PD-(D/E)XK nuclease family protein [Candidatus Aerophobetes bacterium]